MGIVFLKDLFYNVGINMPLHRDKYQQVILYLCWNLGKEIHGKKKLAKLLYFVDFDFFEKYNTSITGDVYKALPMGPFPASLDKIILEMENERIIKVKSVEEREGYLPTEVYSCTTSLKLNNPTFKDEEKQMLDRVLKNYGQLTGKQLEDLTHNEAPYIGTELKKEIPYELAFYRGTDFSDL